MSESSLAHSEQRKMLPEAPLTPFSRVVCLACGLPPHRGHTKCMISRTTETGIGMDGDWQQREGGQRKALVDAIKDDKSLSEEDMSKKEEMPKASAVIHITAFG